MKLSILRKTWRLWAKALGEKASPDNNEGPNRVDTRFFFGRNSIFDPRVFRMKINPNNLDREYKLSFFSSYLTTDSYGSETFYRTFSINFEPAVELQITNIPRNGKISYGERTSSSIHSIIDDRIKL